MKQRFTYLMAAFLMMLALVAQPLGMRGQTRTEEVVYTLDGTITGGSSGYAAESEITQNDMTWMVTGNTTMNPWRIGGKSLSSVDRPVYSTDAMSDNITKIVVTHGTAANVTVNSMTLIVSANADFSNPTSTLTGDFAASSTTTFNRPAATDWTGMYYKIIYNITITQTSNKYLQFVKAEFYKESGGMESVATPTFSPAAGSYTTTQNVTINCETTGATIYYTLDGSAPTTSSSVYSTPIAISETTTVKAMAVKSGMNNSSIATAVYNFPEVYANIAAWKAAHTATSSVVSGISGDLTAVFQNGTTLYVQDATGGLLIYGSLGKTYNNGDVISGGVFGTSQLYNGTMEFKPTSTFPEGVAGTAVQPTVVTVAEILADYSTYADRLVKIEGITFDENHTFATNNSANRTTTFTQGESSMTCYDSFKVLAGLQVTAGENADIIGLVGCYNATKQIFPRSTDDIIEALPTYYNVNVATGIANGSVTTDPTSALEGATITVTATPYSGYELATLTYSYGSSVIDIDQTTMQFTMPASDVTVNATFTELAHVANPTFTPATGTYITAQEVTIACATEEATIYYTLDGTDPTTSSTVYSEAFMVSATTTVKALAVKAGMNNSDVTSATYTIIEQMTMAEARTLANNEYALVQGVVTFIEGRNVYAQDATAGIDLYLNNNTVPSTLAVGDMVLAYGKKTVYNGLVELTSINGGAANQFVIVSTGNPLPVAVKTIAEILADHAGTQMLQSTRVQIVDATIGTINNNNNTPITQGESTLNIYKLPVVAGLEEGDMVTVTGVIGCYNAPQLRVNSAADVTYTHPAGVFVTPSSLSGFTYVVDEGPSIVKTFNITGRSLTAPTYIHSSESYEISSFPGDYFYPENTITINSGSGTYNYTIKVRLKAGLAVGEYNESLTINQAEVDDITFNLTGNVTGEQPQPTGDYTRISDISALTDGSKVIFAARFDENANQYYAMTAQASGKPTGVLFTSETTDSEVLPAEIADEEETYYWTVGIVDGGYTFTNANGDVLGYTSSTNFATGGDNIAWAITYQTSEATAMVPEYSAFVINNVNTPIRAFALNSNHNFGPYHTQNMAADNYNFFIDIFATAGGGTLTCATPTFAPEAGTYYEEQEVTLACITADATIYYTTDGSDPTAESAVYTEPIAVAESMTIKAIAMKEGYENSNIATAEYTIILGAVTIFNQDWEGDMNGWTFVTVEGGNAWTIAQYSGNHYAYANGYNGGVNEQWCISPAFDLNVYSNASLSFRNAKNYNGPDVQLFFSNNYNGETPATATWSELEFNKSTGSYTWTESGSIDLSTFTGDNCYIGFKYTSTETEAAAWEIDDITLMGFTSEPYLTVTPSALNGFTHRIGEGPSASQTFVLTAGNITPAPGGTTGSINVTVASPFEISLDDENYDSQIFFEDVTNLEATTIYVRMNGTEVGQYTEAVNINASSGNEATVTLSGTVTEQPQPGGDWNRIYALADLHDGDQVILASRYDVTVGDGYYAMPAVVTGKPDGVLFTSVNDGGVEKLPAEIADNADTYLWNVIMNGDVITLVNAEGDSLGYSSSTNFSGNVQTEWNIALMTSEEGAMIPNYTGFVITNGETTNRGIAKNASHKFGAYSTSNMTSADYNFFLDLFVSGGVVTPTVATPVFSMASGTYYEEIDIEINCATEGATIYYTTDGSDPTAESTVYTEAIHVDSDVTIKAIAMMEGYDNSGIATANYVIITDVIVLLNQDWEGEMNGWTFVTVAGNKPWTIGQYSGNHYANANGYGDDVDNEQWCISPAFNLNARDYQNVTLTFRNATKFDGPALELYISTDYDGQDPTAATWEPLDYIASEGNYTWTESGEISLNDFTGENCHIAFRYISTIEEGASAWEVDDILVTAEIGSSVITAEASLNVDVWNSYNELMIVNNGNGALNVTVFNLVGQNVLSANASTGVNVIRHNLTDGVYIVRIADGKEMTGIKVVVRR